MKVHHSPFVIRNSSFVIPKKSLAMPTLEWIGKKAVVNHHREGLAKWALNRR